MEGGVVERKRPIIDFNSLLRDEDDDEAEPLLVVEKTDAAKKRKEMENGDKLAEQFRGVSENELIERIARFNRSLSLSHRLPDRGQKLKENIKRHENELERRKLQNKDGEKCKKLKQFHDLSCSDGFRQKTPSSIPNSGSEFATRFSKKMDEKIDHITKNVFKKELPIYNHSDRLKTRPSEYQSSRGRHKGGLSSKKTQLHPCSGRSLNVHKQNRLTGDQKDRCSRSPSRHHSKDALPYRLAKERNISQDEDSNDLRNHNTVVLVDEEESEVAETTQQIDPIDECMKEATIYYPSREDPESVEVRFVDLKYLAPEAYLSSTIVNVYIRYLQHKYSSKEEGCNYHSLNTYFYPKLQAAVSKDDWETSFAKIRRWWKGVSLFEKAYIFIPINEDLHWSLVIICIPDKEDETGPKMLHLDSLGLHNSKLIFKNIRRLLIGEWEFLRKGVDLPDLPMANTIWDHLPQKILEKTIEVPKQRNEYDCGLFVLFFIERFIKESPERLKEKDLAMFGKQWFKPVEASSLRKKIRDLLKEEFKKSKEKNLHSDA